MGNEVKNSKGLIIAILIILVEAVIGFIAYNKNINNTEKENTQESQIENNKDNTDEIENNNNDGIALYNGKKGDKYYLYKYNTNIYNAYKEKQESDEYSLVGEYVCNYNGCNVLNVANDKYAVIYDKEYFIYDFNEEKTIEYLNFEKIKYGSMESIVNENNNIVGIILENNYYSDIDRTVAYYDVKNQKFIINFGTHDYIKTNSKLLEKNQIIATNDFYGEEDYKSILYDFKEDKILNKKINGYIAGDNVLYYTVDCGMEISELQSIYDENLNLIFETKKQENAIRSEDFYITEDDKFVFTDHNKFYIYGNDYKLEYTSREFDNIEAVFKDYILVVENDYLKLFDYKGNEKAQFCELTKDNYVHPSLSGWYTENGKNGIYVVVETLNSSEEKNGYEYYYIPTTGEIGKIATEVGGYAKPVLYLYPENDNTKVKVEFEKPELLTTTYPKYINSWSVIANKNGDLKDTKGKYYYGLYWEEKGNTKVDFKEGFYVEKESAIKFLEEKLDAIGLNEREANEFIMYWLPILEKNDKNLVYFELTEERQKFNRIDITPKPDSLLRMAIHVKKVDKKTNIKEQKFTKFKREGFTAVEWGGTIN